MTRCDHCKKTPKEYTIKVTLLGITKVFCDRCELPANQLVLRLCNKTAYQPKLRRRAIRHKEAA